MSFIEFKGIEKGVGWGVWRRADLVLRRAKGLVLCHFTREFCSGGRGGGQIEFSRSNSVLGTLDTTSLQSTASTL